MEKGYRDRIINYALRTCGYYPLRAMQLWLIDSHFNKANSTMMNIGALLKLTPGIDLNRFTQAINDTLNNYDIFRCRLVFHPETNDICQRFDGEIIPVKIEKISDEEFEERKKILVKPYELINKPLYRIYIFQTPTACYLYSDFYHAILDGTAISMLFRRELNMRYKGKKISRQSLNYADYILEELKISPEELAEGNKFWSEMVAGFDEEKHLPPADIEAKEEYRQNYLFAKLENITQDYFSQSKRKENIFFLAASMLTIAKLSGAKSSVMSWLHNGRSNAQERRLMGIMIEQFPISWNFEEDISVENFLDGLEEKINTSYKYRRSLGSVYSEGLEDECATFIFQKKFYSALVDEEDYEIIELPSNEWSAVENSLDIEINLAVDKKFYLYLDYDASRYSESAMEKFDATFDEIVLKLQDKNILISDIL